MVIGNLSHDWQIGWLEIIWRSSSPRVCPERDAWRSRAAALGAGIRNETSVTSEPDWEKRELGLWLM